jgi:hypothetical protein
MYVLHVALPLPLPMSEMPELARASGEYYEEVGEGSRVVEIDMDVDEEE